MPAENTKNNERSRRSLTLITAPATELDVGLVALTERTIAPEL